MYGGNEVVLIWLLVLCKMLVHLIFERDVGILVSDIGIEFHSLASDTETAFYPN